MALRIVTYRKKNNLPKLQGSSVFHSNELFRVFEKTRGYSPIMTVVFDNEKIVARMLGVIRKSIRLFPPSLIQRCEFYDDGEYFDDQYDRKKIFDLMLSHITRMIKHKSFLIEFRNLENSLSGYEAFRKNYYFPINWLRIYNSLHSKPPFERLSSSRRRQINKATKAGVTIELTQNEQEIIDLSLILKRIYSSKVRKHFPDINFFTLLEKESPNKEISKIFVVKYKKRIIGGSLCIFSTKKAYLWYWGGMKNYHPFLYPGVMAVWGAINYSYKEGYEQIEFMDGSIPFKKNGYKDFILRFGGKQTSTRRWFRFRWNWLNKLLFHIYI